MATKVYGVDLSAAIFEAIQIHGKHSGIPSKNGVTTVNQWNYFVRKDGHKIPDLARWLAGDVRFAVEPLLGLAEVFRSYGVEINGELMPRDYFVSIYIYGKYKELSAPTEEAEGVSLTVPWIKKGLMSLPTGDRVAILGWFLGLVSRSVQSAEVSTSN